MKRLTIALLFFVSALALPSFTQEKTPKGADLLRKLEADFAKAVAEHGHDAFVSYFAEDGVELEDGGGIKTKDDMRKESAWPPDFSLTWVPVKAEMAASGDLGYTYGKYELNPRTKMGSSSPTTESMRRSGRNRKMARGKWCSTWGIPARLLNPSEYPRIRAFPPHFSTSQNNPSQITTHRRLQPGPGSADRGREQKCQRCPPLRRVV